jgi:transglutaminase-like putative cysteine protease
MSAPGARLPLPLPVPRAWPAARPSPRALAALVRLLAFAALAVYVATAWLGMIINPPAGRAILTLIAVVAGAAALMALGANRVPKRLRWALAPLVVGLTIAVGAMAMGLPARLTLPWNWDELATNLGGGWGVLWNVDYPYDGTLVWTRLVILLGLPLTLGAAGALAFWPARRAAPALRAIALAVLVAAYGLATTISAPSAPLLHGVLLLALVWAWLWLPGRRALEVLAGGAVIALAALLALPIAGSLSGRGALVDYRSWGSDSPAVGHTESFVWDQSYGPLTWPRVGQTMFEVRSDGPYYWRTAVLDQFDGSSWVQSDQPGDAALQLPQRQPGSSSPRLNPAWIHQLEYSIQGLNSNLVVGAGAPLGLPTINGVTVMDRGLLLPTSEPLSTGESYVMRSYIPDPSPAQMRKAPTRYPASVGRDVRITLPSGQPVDIPFWGSVAGGPADQALASSAYGGVYRLAHQVTAGARTPYDAVSAIETYLNSRYRYSEFAPIRHLALRTFLLGAHRGYCQHFSGAMALMLRMVGIPARVAAGFSPGRPNSDGNYVVTDFDAHSWVETYFPGIGWVTFDPTPAGAPAQSRVSGLGSSIASSADPNKSSGSSGSNGKLHKGTVDVPSGSSSTPGSGQPMPLLPLLPIAGALALLAGLAAALGKIRRWRRRGMGADDLTEAQLREVASALERVRSWRTRGATLLGLERRLAAEVGPGAAAYVARIRAAQYAPGDNPPPGMSLRGALRRELASGRGIRGRLRSLLAIPPGGPSAVHANHRSGQPVETTHRPAS